MRPLFSTERCSYKVNLNNITFHNFRIFTAVYSTLVIQWSILFFIICFMTYEHISKVMFFFAVVRKRGLRGSTTFGYFFFIIEPRSLKFGMRM